MLQLCLELRDDLQMEFIQSYIKKSFNKKLLNKAAHTTSATILPVSAPLLSLHSHCHMRGYLLESHTLQQSLDPLLLPKLPFEHLTRQPALAKAVGSSTHWLPLPASFHWQAAELLLQPLVLDGLG